MYTCLCICTCPYLPQFLPYILGLRFATRWIFVFIGEEDGGGGGNGDRDGDGGGDGEGEGDGDGDGEDPSVQQKGDAWNIQGCASRRGGRLCLCGSVRQSERGEAVSVWKCGFGIQFNFEEKLSPL
jgi:hypothetical protein